MTLDLASQKLQDCKESLSLFDASFHHHNSGVAQLLFSASSWLPYILCLKYMALHTCGSSHSDSKFMSCSFICGCICDYKVQPVVMFLLMLLHGATIPPVLHKASFLFEVRLVACYPRWRFFYLFIYFLWNQSISINLVTFSSYWGIAVTFWSCFLVLWGHSCSAAFAHWLAWKMKRIGTVAPLRPRFPSSVRGTSFCFAWLPSWHLGSLLSIHPRLETGVPAYITLPAL